ncbi:hypothetical protein ASG36_03650 [Geodermatophilus sp. Leaf369]|uniref:antitoxin n=1 Tax=Geodermatophilus sp. Leaf369 TaxID=1736354 RepID=UPI0006F600C6|nr:antitoxin [Geodermatophilus sp. Leaf369]KQS60099.1 hypothetical protein ASG36_03650 [Geodermatophilus sp. Leaf369]QNG37912.1 antitoxin [Geodermatophilaceae bacterium NBWT11]
MVDFGKIAKQAQQALSDSAEKLETAVKDNAGKIEGAVDKAGQFAKDKFPDKAAQIDQAASKAKGAVPRHEDATGTSAPGSPLSSVPTPVETAPTTTLPTDTPPDPSATPEVDRTAAEAAGVQSTSPSSAGFAPPAPSPTPEVDRVVRDQG